MPAHLSRLALVFCSTPLLAQAAEPLRLTRFEVVAQEHTIEIGWSIEGEREGAIFRLAAQCGSSRWGIKYVDTESGDFLARDTPEEHGARGSILYQVFARSAASDWSLLGERTIELTATARLPRLLGAVPNPFNPRTSIVLWLPARTRVELAVYDLAGRRVRTLLRGQQLDAGRHTLGWDGRDERGQRLASGGYIARLEAAGVRRSQRLTLLK